MSPAGVAPSTAPGAARYRLCYAPAVPRFLPPRMLLGLTIRDVVLIDRLTLAFRPGLCVLTGETGAGKSILLDALGLALGRRADASLVRSGEDGAAVSAELELPSAHRAFDLLREQGIDVDA